MVSVATDGSLAASAGSTTESSMLRLMQLSSVSLPVGAFAFSQGLEAAIDLGWIRNDRDVAEWLELQLNHSLARLELPLVFRFYQSLEQADYTRLDFWNQYLLASRETAELHLADSATGAALARLLSSLKIENPLSETMLQSFTCLFCVAARHWQIPVKDAALGIAWAWLENQIAAATKLVPLGQTQAQKLLAELQTGIPAAIASAEKLADEDLGGSLPALAIASALHETQYSRLFRS